MTNATASNTAGVTRFSPTNPCPICGGHDDVPRGKGARCYGFLGGDGLYGHCSREEHAHGLSQEANGTYAHRLSGDCKCGQRHGDAPSSTSNGHGSAHGSTLPVWKDPAWRLVATFVYRHANGSVALRVQRWEHRTERNSKGKPRKTFLQHLPRPEGGWTKPGDAPRVPYRLPELLKAPLTRPVYIVEGERCADFLASWGLVATCNSEGARKGSWRPELTPHFAGRDVVILADSDDDGQRHALEVATALHGTAAPLRIMTLPDLPEGGDVIDFAAAGGTVERLHAIADAAPEWSPMAETPISAISAISANGTGPHNQAGDPWETPIPLTSYNLPPFPVQALPAWQRAFVMAEAVAAQVPVDLPAVVTLGATSAVCASKCEVKAKERTHRAAEHLLERCAAQRQPQEPRRGPGHGLHRSA